MKEGEAAIRSLALMMILPRVPLRPRSCRARPSLRRSPCCTSARSSGPATGFGPRRLGTAHPLAEVFLRVGAVELVREHLDVGVELLNRVGRARVAAEVDAAVDVAELGVDADLLPPLLDQRLRRLAHRVGRGLVEDRELLAVLLAHAVRADRPAGVVEELLRRPRCPASCTSRCYWGGVHLRRRNEVAGRLARPRRSRSRPASRGRWRATAPGPRSGRSGTGAGAPASSARRRAPGRGRSG